jgi:3-mercaptopyruvate sulfurtransferase SseA
MRNFLRYKVLLAAAGWLLGAQMLPAEVFRSNPDKLAEVLGAAGILASDEAVVVSEAGLTKDAALAFALLENMGHVASIDLVNADGTPKAAKEIRDILTNAGVPRYAELVCTSDDPGEAAVNYFVRKLMGYPDVKVLVR